MRLRHRNAQVARCVGVVGHLETRSKAQRTSACGGMCSCHTDVSIVAARKVVQTDGTDSASVSASTIDRMVLRSSPGRSTNVGGVAVAFISAMRVNMFGLGQSRSLLAGIEVTCLQTMQAASRVSRDRNYFVCA